MYDEPCVSVVDDDAAVLKAIDRVLRSAGYAVRTFPSSHEFLHKRDADTPGCLVVDLRLPGLDGLQLQEALATIGDPCPVVFITGDADVLASVKAMKAGAIDFLVKPFDREQLLSAVRIALDKDRTARMQRAAHSSIGARVSALTPREKQVMAHVIAGHLNKQIAAELGISEKTVKVHRARVMKKMGVASVAELVTRVSSVRT